MRVNEYETTDMKSLMKRPLKHFIESLKTAEGQGMQTHIDSVTEIVR